MGILCEKINVVTMSVLHSCHQLTLWVCTNRQKFLWSSVQSSALSTHVRNMLGMWFYLHT